MQCAFVLCVERCTRLIQREPTTAAGKPYFDTPRAISSPVAEAAFLSVSIGSHPPPCERRRICRRTNKRPANFRITPHRVRRVFALCGPHEKPSRQQRPRTKDKKRVLGTPSPRHNNNMTL